MREAQRIIDLTKNSDAANVPFQQTTPLYVVIAVLTILLITFMGLAAAYFLKKKQQRKSEVVTISKTMSDLSALRC